MTWLPTPAQVLEMEHKNVKALLRRAISRDKLGDLRADADMMAALKLLQADPIITEAKATGTDGSSQPALSEVPLMASVTPADVSEIFHC